MTPKPIAHLARAIAGPLPGSRAQYHMAPDRRAGPEVSTHPPADARQAAVLILFYPGETDELRIPMMLRPARTGPHSGQISFPGGAYESHDPDLEATALRESEEELGIPPADVRVLGQLSKLYVPPSGYLVSPYVGWAARRPEFVPDPGEVERILEIPLAHLLRNENRRSEERETYRGRIRVPYFSFFDDGDEHKIWGASAMIMAELLALLNERESDPRE